MATLPVSSLVPYLRAMLFDNDPNMPQRFSDTMLVNEYLVTAIRVENAILGNTLSCPIQLNDDDPENYFWEFITTPEDWLQIFFCIAACLRMRSWEEYFSFDDGVNKVTNHNIKDIVNALKETYNAILQERKFNCAGYAYNTWDDFFSRPNLILNEISEGFR